jgi:hypothetical protein
VAYRHRHQYLLLHSDRRCRLLCLRTDRSLSSISRPPRHRRPLIQGGWVLPLQPAHRRCHLPAHLPCSSHPRCRPRPPSPRPHLSRCLRRLLPSFRLRLSPLTPDRCRLPQLSLCGTCRHPPYRTLHHPVCPLTVSNILSLLPSRIPSNRHLQLTAAASISLSICCTSRCWWQKRSVSL